MPRFFLSAEELGGTFAVLTGENAAHAKVLRLKSGDAVTLCDGHGMDFSGIISDVSPGQFSVVILRVPHQRQSSPVGAVFRRYAPPHPMSQR